MASVIATRTTIIGISAASKTSNRGAACLYWSPKTS